MKPQSRQPAPSGTPAFEARDVGVKRLLILGAGLAFILLTVGALLAHVKDRLSGSAPAVKSAVFDGPAAAWHPQLDRPQLQVTPRAEEEKRRTQQVQDLEQGRTPGSLPVTKAMQLMLEQNHQASRTGPVKQQPAESSTAALVQHMNAQIPGDISLVDDDGSSVLTSQLLDGRPTVVTLVYDRCPNLCGLVQQDLFKAVKESGLNQRKDLNFVVVSVDPRDNVASMQRSKARYLQQLGQSTAALHFLSGSAAATERLSDALGIKFRYDAKSDQYAHPAVLVVLTPERRISRYLLGLAYPARDLRLAVTEASGGRIQSPVDQFLLMCFHYDAATGRYGVAVQFWMRAIGLGAAAALAIAVWRLSTGRRPSAAATA